MKCLFDLQVFQKDFFTNFFGNPTPEISWFKDNSSTPVKAKWSSIDNNGSLIIQGLCKYIKQCGVRLPNDRRLYTSSYGIQAITKEDESHFIL